MPAEESQPLPHSAHHHRWEHHDALLPVDPDLAPDDPGEPSREHHPISHVPRSRQHGVLATIAVGGFAGTLARYGVGLLWPTPSGRFPWATFLVNTSGAFLLGLTLTVLLESFRLTRYLRPFVCVGVLGSWTTMSTFAVESDLLVKDGRPGTFLAYVVATVVVGLAATWAGIGLARSAASRSVRWASR